MYDSYDVKSLTQTSRLSEEIHTDLQLRSHRTGSTIGRSGAAGGDRSHVLWSPMPLLGQREDVAHSQEPLQRTCLMANPKALQLHH